MKSKAFKIIFIGLITIIGIYLFLVIMPIRTTKTMEWWAWQRVNADLQEVFGMETYNKLMHDSMIKGPIIRPIKNGWQFQWYVPLEWGDSASFYKNVYSNPIQVGWREYMSVSTSMNYQTKYLQYLNGFWHFVDILPYKMRGDTALLANLKLDRSHQLDTDNEYKPIKEKETLYYFLEKGFFRTTKKTNDYSVVEFFEPIGWKFVDESNKGINSTNKQYTEKARIDITEDFNVQITLVDR